MNTYYRSKLVHNNYPISGQDLLTSVNVILSIDLVGNILFSVKLHNFLLSPIKIVFHMSLTKESLFKEFLNWYNHPNRYASYFNYAKSKLFNLLDSKFWFRIKNHSPQRSSKTYLPFNYFIWCKILKYELNSLESLIKFKLQIGLRFIP